MPETMTPTPTPEQNPDVPKAILEQGDAGEFKTSYIDPKPESKMPADFEAASGLTKEDIAPIEPAVVEVPDKVVDWSEKRKKDLVDFEDIDPKFVKQKDTEMNDAVEKGWEDVTTKEFKL